MSSRARGKRRFQTLGQFFLDNQSLKLEMWGDLVESSAMDEMMLAPGRCKSILMKRLEETISSGSKKLFTLHQAAVSYVEEYYSRKDGMALMADGRLNLFVKPVKPFTKVS
jgi:hypothetical protein